MQYDLVGELKGNHIIIKDQKSGNRLYNRGSYGTPLSGGGLELELIEGFYLLDNKKIKLYKNKRLIGLEELLTYITKREPTFEIKYIVYRDLRQRGQIVKSSNISDFVIYDSSVSNGAGPRKKLIKYWSMAVSERAQFDICELASMIEAANNTRKKLLFGVVDEEGDLTYYEISGALLKARAKRKPAKHTLTGSAMLVEDRVMLWEPALITELRSIGFYGKEVGSSLQLALTESIYLMRQDILEIRLARTRRKLSLKQFMKIARKIQPDFDRRLAVYNELKSRGFIVKTGFKYGTHFRVYKGDPESDHSEYLVHSVPEDFTSTWEETSRAVRLAQGVRKQMLFGRVMDDVDKIEYINIERVKP